MKFITLYWFLQDHNRTCPCGQSASNYWHDDCYVKMPANWVVPHCSSHTVSLLKQVVHLTSHEDRVARLINKGFPPKPVRFGGTVYEEWDYWQWAGYWNRPGSWIF